MGANCAIEQQASGKVVIKAEATPPCLASACSSITLAEKCGSASFAEKDSKGMTNHRLLVATRDNDIEGIQTCLEEGAYLETRRPFVMRPKPPTLGGSDEGSFGKKKKKAPKEGLTPLMYAAQNGSAEAVQLLIDAKSQVCARDEEGVHALHLAAAASAHEVVKMLLDAGADRDAVDDDGKRPIDYVPASELAAKMDRSKWEESLGIIDPSQPVCAKVVEAKEESLF